MNIRSSPTLSEADADALLSGRVVAGHDDLREIVDLMITASAVPSPMPNAALAAMLDTGLAGLPVRSAQHGSRSRRWSARIAVAMAAAMTGTLGAATANALPAPLQTTVANVVGAVTPLQLPRPPADGGTGSENRDGTADEPAADPFEQPRRNAETGANEPSGESADESTAPGDEADVDELDAGESEADESEQSDSGESDAGEAEPEPETGEPEADEPEADEPEADEPEAEADEPEQPDSGEMEPRDAEELELDSYQPEQDELDAGA